MDGHISSAIEHRGLHFFDEYSLAADGRDGSSANRSPVVATRIGWTSAAFPSSSAMWAVCQRAKALPRVAARNMGEILEIEQVPESFSQAVAPRRSGRVLQPDGGLVQELAHQPSCGRLHRRLLGSGQPASVAVQLLFAKNLGPSSEGGNQGSRLAS